MLVPQGGTSLCCQKRGVGWLLWCRACLHPQQYLPRRQRAWEVSFASLFPNQDCSRWFCAASPRQEPLRSTKRLGDRVPEGDGADSSAPGTRGPPGHQRGLQCPLWRVSQPCCSGEVVSARTVRQCNIGVFRFRRSSAYLVVMVTEVKSLQQRKGAVVAPTSRHSVVWVCTLEPELRHSRQEILLGFGCWAVGLTWKIICCEVRGLPWRQNCLVAEMKVAAALYLPWGRGTQCNFQFDSSSWRPRCVAAVPNSLAMETDSTVGGFQ